MGHWQQMVLLVTVLATYGNISECLLGTVLGTILQENTAKKIDLQPNGNMVPQRQIKMRSDYVSPPVINTLEPYL